MGGFAAVAVCPGGGSPAAGAGKLAVPVGRAAPGTARHGTTQRGEQPSPRSPRRPAAFASRLIAPVTLQFPK